MNRITDAYMYPERDTSELKRAGMMPEEEEEDDEEDGEKSDSELDEYEPMAMSVEEKIEESSDEKHVRRPPRSERVQFKVDEKEMDTTDQVLAPPKLWVSAATSVSVLITWLPPSDVYNAPFEYKLEQCHVPGTNFIPVANAHTGLIPSHIVSELITGQGYMFRVIAVKDGIQSPPSEPSSVFIVDTPFKCNHSDVSTEPPPFYKFSGEEMQLFSTLDTPQKVQDYIDEQPMNHEIVDDTCLSPLEALRQNHQHCIEGAMLAAYILSLHGYAPVMCDMRSSSDDDDHLVVPFEQEGHWGAISKSNHSSLRYRNPVYRSLRELMISYWDDYMNGQGVRTLRSYSEPVNLSETFGENWAEVRGNVFEIAERMDVVPHVRLVELENIKVSRAADLFMKKTTVSQREWPEPANMSQDALERNANK